MKTGFVTLLMIGMAMGQGGTPSNGVGVSKSAIRKTRPKLSMQRLRNSDLVGLGYLYGRVSALALQMPDPESEVGGMVCSQLETADRLAEEGKHIGFESEFVEDSIGIETARKMCHAPCHRIVP